MIFVEDLRQSKVGQLDISLSINDNVLGLKTSLEKCLLTVYDLVLVKGLKSENDLSCVELSSRVNKIDTGLQLAFLDLPGWRRATHLDSTRVRSRVSFHPGSTF